MAFFSPASSFVAAAIHWLATSAVFSLPASLRLGGQRRHADRLRIGVLHVARQARPAKDDDEAMLLHRLDEDLVAGDFDLAQADGQRGAFLAWECGRRGGR